ncbi:MAG: hypothetical protein U0359_29800 [Byssovorax sp.]
MRPALLFTLIPLMVFGCSATSDPNQFQSTSAGSGGNGTGGDGIGGTDFTGSGGSSGTAGGSANGCSEAATLIYVLSTDNDLYSFQPQQKQFSKIGHLGCNTSMQPNSMAIDRDAVAWVNYVKSDGLGSDTAGAVFKVSTKDASCSSSPVKLSSGWFRLGMGFSSNMAGSTEETLFVTGTGDGLGNPSPGLGRIDFGANKVVPIGQFSGNLAGENAELTGTGDAELYGFFTTTPVHVSKIDKTNGKIAGDKTLPAVETPSAWAFSFWGGDFYLYTAPDPTLNPDRTSNVTRYRPSDGSVDTGYMKNVGFIIVGAGVSTCAPLTPPK